MPELHITESIPWDMDVSSMKDSAFILEISDINEEKSGSGI